MLSLSKHEPSPVASATGLLVLFYQANTGGFRKLAPKCVISRAIRLIHQSLTQKSVIPHNRRRSLAEQEQVQE
jgi:hypothetical protein